MKSIVSAFLVIIILLTTGCSGSPSTPANPDVTPPINEIVSISQSDYRAYEYRLLDLYFIACALYFDFESDYLLPDPEMHAAYNNAKEYFYPFQDHPFIKGLSPYVDEEHLAEHLGVVSPLMMYAFSLQDYGIGIGTVQTDAFADANAFNDFLAQLMAFYDDTNADGFFDSEPAHLAMLEYVRSEIPSSPLQELLVSMEDYVGNKGDLYGDNAVHYRAVLTVFKPLNASFYDFQTDDAIYLVQQISPTTTEKDPEVFDIERMVLTSLHEFLHNYINQPISEYTELIDQTAGNRSTQKYAGSDPRYQAMAWQQIADENIVRAVTAALYADYYSDRQKAFDQVLLEEIEYGKMERLEDLYLSLLEYENNRDRYPTIRHYIPTLIEVLFDE